MTTLDVVSIDDEVLYTAVHFQNGNRPLTPRLAAMSLNGHHMNDEHIASLVQNYPHYLVRQFHDMYSGVRIPTGILHTLFQDWTIRQLRNEYNRLMDNLLVPHEETDLCIFTMIAHKVLVQHIEHPLTVPSAPVELRYDGTVLQVNYLLDKEIQKYSVQNGTTRCGKVYNVQELQLSELNQ